MKNILIEAQNQEINSPIFKDKKASGFVTAYNIDNDYELKAKEKLDSLANKVFSAFCCSPDGGLVWIPKSYNEQFKSYCAEYMKTNVKKLNFKNGGIAETFIFHDVEEGLIVEMIDPDCFSDIFDNLIENFMKVTTLEKAQKATDLDKVFYFTDCHMATNVTRKASSAQEWFEPILKKYKMI
jgi:hypothetical protein